MMPETHTKCRIPRAGPVLLPAAQSLEVDAITGATLSTQTILKAVENALIFEGGT